jgi:hypothetical protein
MKLIQLMFQPHNLSGQSIADIKDKLSMTAILILRDLMINGLDEKSPPFPISCLMLI